MVGSQADDPGERKPWKGEASPRRQGPAETQGCGQGASLTGGFSFPRHVSSAPAPANGRVSLLKPAERAEQSGPAEARGPAHFLAGGPSPPENQVGAALLLLLQEAMAGSQPQGTDTQGVQGDSLPSSGSASCGLAGDATLLAGLQLPWTWVCVFLSGRK